MRPRLSLRDKLYLSILLIDLIAVPTAVVFALRTDRG